VGATPPPMFQNFICSLAKLPTPTPAVDKQLITHHPPLILKATLLELRADVIREE
jgi:hypothetical protein